MKKIIVGILALVYITTSTGAVIHMHYCMDKLVDWELGVNNSKTCSPCGMQESKEKDDCCKDKHTFLKNDSEQKKPESVFHLIQLIPVVLPASLVEIPPGNFVSVIVQNSFSHAPHRSSSIPVYIRNCVFLI